MSNQSLYCVKAQKDPLAWSIYQHLQKNYQQSDKAFDQGFVETYFHKGPTPIQQLVSVNNGTLCSQEVYNHALSFSQKNQKFAQWLKTKKQIEAPWLKVSPSLKNKFLNYYSKAKVEIEKQKPNSTERSFLVAKAIDHFIRDNEIGLGILYDYKKGVKVRNPDASAKDQLANCLDYVILFKALSNLANEKILILQVNKAVSSKKVFFIDHLVIGIQIPKPLPNQSPFFIFDIDPRSRTSKLDDIFILSNRELISNIWNNRGFHENPYNESTQMKKYSKFIYRNLMLALKLDPENDLMLYNLGTSFGKSGDLKKAIRFLERAANRNPYSQRIYRNIAVAYYKLGQSYFKDLDLKYSASPKYK